MRTGSINTLRFDSPIRFGTEGNFLTFGPRGFEGRDSATHTWTNGFVASLQLRILPLVDAAQLSIDADPFVAADKLPFQTMNIYINGLWIGFTRAERTELLTVPLPPTYVAPGENVLAFAMPNATRPREIGMGDDERRLGFAFHQIALTR